MRRRIYIAGPLTNGGGSIDNAAVGRAMDAYRELIERGYAPFCPHLSAFADPRGEIAHETWMEVSLALIEGMEAVLRLPGKSVGATREVNHALIEQVPVVHSIDELDQLFDTKGNV